MIEKPIEILFLKQAQDFIDEIEEPVRNKFFVSMRKTKSRIFGEMDKTKKYRTLEELEDKYIGETGTPKRDQYEFELSMEILGEKLKQIRKEQRLTQEQLGKLIGVQKAQISKLESGNNSATISTVLKVFQAMKAKVKLKVEIV